MRLPRKNPGGWSSHGQPVDQLHHQLREKIRELDVESLGMSADLRSRSRFHEVDLRSSGHLHQEVLPWVEIVKMTYKAWTRMDRRIFQSAWLLCGYFSEEHMSRWQGDTVSQDSRL